MRIIGYYLSLPFIYLTSILPFRILYLLSDILNFFIFNLIGYRKKVILENLTKSFPEKSPKEIHMIYKDFCRFFCDLTLESVKLLTISEKKLREIVFFEDPSLFEKYFKEHQSVILVLGHFGNWELAGARLSLEAIHQLVVIYHPLGNKHFDKLVHKLRSRTGTELLSMNETLRGMIKNKNRVTATGFVGDQRPSPTADIHMTFLNQETTVFNGTEKIAKKFKYPVIYLSVKPRKRGLYEIKTDLLCENPELTKEEEISKMHMKRLEEDIKENPAYWLWSHDRWKYNRQ
ncbi:lysophospholipid acyltransferase family protein [Flexithrix dorotheae]|uniref:lysophospholipid acyltransferase family protein n=1 Tax=Flexithrix dorotheae TaxID=70993 RepID=UPI0003672677|nr:lysophospholipid acyltransferase family protein [Flexithrix dorotheae]